MVLSICDWDVLSESEVIKIWPDGCRDLIALIDGQAQTAQIWCTGIDQTTRLVTAKPGTRFIGVRLMPGVRFPWEIHSPEWLSSDQTLSHPGRSGRLIAPDDLLQATTDEVRLMLHELRNTAESCDRWITEFLLDPQKPASIGLTKSSRSIRRHVSEKTGVSPKFWLNLKRVRAAAFCCASCDIPFSAIASDHGYSDQAHMIRDMRRWLGQTPLQVRKMGAEAIARLSAPNAFNL